MGWLTGSSTHYLRDALVKSARRAALAERELAWHERLADANEWRAERDYSVLRCERLLSHALAFGVVSERGARRLAGCIYDALALERRRMKRLSYPGDPEGHWQQMEALAEGINSEWARDRWRVAWNERRIFQTAQRAKAAV